MDPLSTSYLQVLDRISALSSKLGRAAPPHLLVVSKGQPVSRLLPLIQEGQTAFGENYLQEALPKIAALLAYPLEWHFIGTLQSNKTRLIAKHFAWVHGLSDRRIAERLHTERPLDAPRLQVCIQVDLDEESQKAGLPPSEILPFIKALAPLERLQVRGLMALPKARKTEEEQRASLRRLRHLLETLQAEGEKLDTLSMGTSDDMMAAIAEGSHWLRIGRAIFGDRP